MILQFFDQTATVHIQQVFRCVLRGKLITGDDLNADLSFEYLPGDLIPEHPDRVIREKVRAEKMNLQMPVIFL